MTRSRLWPVPLLAAGLFLVLGESAAQPPNLVPVKPKLPPGDPNTVVVGNAGAELPVVPKSAAAFVTLRIADVIDHPDLKAVLEQLKKTPEAFEGVTELFGVRPHEMERVTLFWPTVSARGPGDPVVVVTTREPFNEARVLKALRAAPVFGDGPFGGGPFGGGGFGPGESIKKPTRTPEAFPDNRPTDPVPPKGFPGGPGGGPPGPPPFGPGGGPGSFPPPPATKPAPPPPSEKKDGVDDLDGTVPISAAVPGDPLFYAVRNGPFEVLLLVDDRTLVFLPGGGRNEFATIALLGQLIQKKPTGPLADAIGGAGGHTLAAGLYLPPLFRESDRQMPVELAPYAALTAARTGTITGDLGKTARLTLRLTFDDAAAARRAAPVLGEGLKALAEKAAGHAAEMKEGRRPAERALAPLLEAAAAGMKKAEVKADGTAVTATGEIDAGPAAAKAVADLLQSFASRKKFAGRTNNLKQIGLALHNYFSAYNRLPANVYGPKGELLLSWRVQLLPYLEQDNLYKQFKMDEPWDSENNRKLVELMPKVFEVPGRDAPKGQTYYQAFLTPGPNRRPKGATPFLGRTWLVEGDKVGQTLLVPDGTSNTIAVVEARNPVVWSKPDDLPFGEKLPPVGDPKADRFMALFLDGSVRAIPTDIKPDVLRILIDGYDGIPTPPGVFDEDGRPARGFPAANPRVDERLLAARRAEELAALDAARNEAAEAELALLRVQLEQARTEAALVEAELRRVKKLADGGDLPKELAEKLLVDLEKKRAVVKDREAKLAAQADRLEQERRRSGSGAVPVRPKGGPEPLPGPKPPVEKK